MDMPVFDEIRNFDPEEQLATRAAWLYFVGSYTQAEIGKKLGLNRIRINRLLALAREQGLVQIKITGRLAECIALEERLKERYKLKHAVVVPTRRFSPARSRSCMKWQRTTPWPSCPQAPD